MVSQDAISEKFPWFLVCGVLEYAFLCDMNEELIEVRSYFTEGGKVVGTERCYSQDEARAFARHQLKYYPYVEVVHVCGISHPWGFEPRVSSVLFRFVG